MQKLTRRLLLSAALAAGISSPSLAAEKLKVVASFSILGDFVSRVGGDMIDLKTIVGPDSDTHVYEPTPDDAKAFAAANLVVVNGLGFEGWLDRLVSASGYKGTTAVASDGITPDVMAAGDEAGETDPHAWQNAANAIVYAINIAKALCAADAANCASYDANAKSYGAELAVLDADVKSAVARIPQERRTIIASHDAFGYFARAYGITVLAPEGISTDSEASAKDVAMLISQIREKMASALFVENISDPRLAEQIARETGLTIGGELFSDALSAADGPAATYVAMMRHNIGLLAKAMAGA